MNKNENRNEREAFEAWCAIGHISTATLDKYPEYPRGTYADSRTHAAWQAWSARTALEAQEKANRIRDGIADYIETYWAHNEYWPPNIADRIRQMEIRPDFLSRSHEPEQAEPLTEEQISAAVKAWFENSHAGSFEQRMRLAFEAAHAAAPQEPSGTKKPEAPKRACRLTLELQADSRSELVRALRTMASRIERSELTCGVSGGPDSGAIYELIEDDGPSHDEYFAQVQAWLDAKQPPQEKP